MARTLFDKIWDTNTVKAESPESPAILFVGLHLLHDVTGPQAFNFLEKRGLEVRRPDLSLACTDHCAPSLKDDSGFSYKDNNAKEQIDALEAYCKKYNVPFLGMGHPKQGIVHVVGPELGLSRPGQVIVCGDSHTSTHGAFGAMAFGIGSSEVSHVLASQCILQRKPKNFRITIKGKLQNGAKAKDLSLHIIKTIGAKGGQGFAIEYAGPVIESMAMEARMTLCNMTIEAGSRFGMIAPDQCTIDYLEERSQKSLTGIYDHLFSDENAIWDRELVIDASTIEPMMTWGTNPALAVELGQPIPSEGHEDLTASLSYMNWSLGQETTGRKVDHVFIGSCTNGRLSDLRLAAESLAGKNVAPHIRCLVVPGSRPIKEQAEREGLDKIFLAAGAQWREPSCSLCNAMNGDYIPEGELSVSTSNRSFEGRQGPGSQTILVNPEVAAAIAIKGEL